MEKDHKAVYQKAADNRLFLGFWFKRKCFSNLYLILAGSWWKNGHNKKRGFLLLIQACLLYPPSIFRIVKKLSS